MSTHRADIRPFVQGSEAGGLPQKKVNNRSASTPPDPSKILSVAQSKFPPIPPIQSVHHVRVAKVLFGYLVGLTSNNIKSTTIVNTPPPTPVSPPIVNQFSTDEDWCSDEIEKHKKDLKNGEKRLESFFAGWPKGENHVHGEAIIPVDRYMDWIHHNPCYYDRKEKKFFREKGFDRIAGNEITGILETEVRDLMSLAGWKESLGQSKKDYFFHVVCPLIDSLSVLMDQKDYTEIHRLMMAELVRQNYTYAPIMMDLPHLRNNDSLESAPSARFVKVFAIMRKNLWINELEFLAGIEIISTKALEELCKSTLSSDRMESVFSEANKKVSKEYEEGKYPKVKIIAPVMRDLPLHEFFEQTAEVFSGANAGTILRGYQLIGDEASRASKSDFQTQVYVIDFFRRQFPKCAISLHAGELDDANASPSTRQNRVHNSIHLGWKVDDEALTKDVNSKSANCIYKSEASQKVIGTAALDSLFPNDKTPVKARNPLPFSRGFVYQSIRKTFGDKFITGNSKVAKVMRVSHGISLSHDELMEIKRLGICVEVCLTSNEVLYGINPDNHLIHGLMREGIFFTINTDDPTHLNTTLTKELIKAAMDYGLTYEQIKNCQRVLRHFSAELTGESIYSIDPKKPGFLKFKKRFKEIEKVNGKLNPNQEKFLAASEKAREQVRWEQAVDKYEAEFRKKETAVTLT